MPGWWRELTFALEQEEVGTGAEGGAEVGAVVHQVAGQALPVEAAHCAGAAGGGGGGVVTAGQTLSPSPVSAPPASPTGDVWGRCPSARLPAETP